MPLKSEFSVLNSFLFANIISKRNQIKCAWNGCWGLETSAVGSESSNSELVRPLINQINIGKDFKATKDFTMDINTINSFGGISGISTGSPLLRFFYENADDMHPRISLLDFAKFGPWIVYLIMLKKLWNGQEDLAFSSNNSLRRLLAPSPHRSIHFLGISDSKDCIYLKYKPQDHFGLPIIY